MAAQSDLCRRLEEQSRGWGTDSEKRYAARDALAVLDTYATIAEDACLATEAAPSMSPKQYKQIIEQLGLSQERAGEWLGVSKRTGQNYALHGPSETAAKLLRLVIRLKLKPEDVR